LGRSSKNVGQVRNNFNQDGEGYATKAILYSDILDLLSFSHRLLDVARMEINYPEEVKKLSWPQVNFSNTVSMIFLLFINNVVVRKLFSTIHKIINVFLEFHCERACKNESGQDR
jgi:hypothetical protein